MVKIEKRGNYYFLVIEEAIANNEKSHLDLEDFILLVDRVGFDFINKNLKGYLADEARDTIIEFLADAEFCPDMLDE